MLFEKAKAKNARVQMSEAFITSVFLALSGGFQDAYTYFTRDEVLGYFPIRSKTERTGFCFPDCLL